MRRILLAAAAVFLVVQDLTGVLLVKAMGHHPAYGLFGGSISFAGGHGTAIAWGETASKAGLTNAAEIGIAMRQLEPAGEPVDRPAAVAGTRRASLSGPPSTIRHYPADDSVFIDGDYLIKGVAGAILCKLVSEYLGDQRTEFTNRELRLDPALRLPDIGDNLEARLILLERRLTERNAPLRIQKTGRGRFRLLVERPLSLTEMR